MNCKIPKLLIHEAISAYYQRILEAALLVPPPPPPPPPSNKETLDAYMEGILSWQKEMLPALQEACDS